VSRRSRRICRQNIWKRSFIGARINPFCAALDPPTHARPGFPKPAPPFGRQASFLKLYHFETENRKTTGIVTGSTGFIPRFIPFSLLFDFAGTLREAH